MSVFGIKADMEKPLAAGESDQGPRDGQKLGDGLPAYRNARNERRNGQGVAAQN